MRSQVFITIVFLIAAGAGLQSARADGGHFELDGERQEFPVVSAFRVRDQFNPNEQQTLVLLTHEAPDREAIMNADDPYTMAINDPATAGDSMMLFVKDDDEVSMNAHIGGVQYLDSSGQIMMQPGSLEAECSANSATHVACEVSTPEPVSAASGKTWSMAAVFDAEVLAREPGKPVPEGGGEPGKALARLTEAMGGDDLEAILAHLSESTANEYRVDWRSPEENLTAVKEMLGQTLPPDGKVTGGEYRGEDEVKMLVEGVMGGDWGDDTLIFEVRMAREGGKWLFDSGRFVGFVE